MWQKEFDYPMERFNPRGGAIALGHPLGASGVALMTRLLRHLEATGGRYGFQTMCEGGGQANGTVIERALDRIAGLRPSATGDRACAPRSHCDRAYGLSAGSASYFVSCARAASCSP